MSALIHTNEFDIEAWAEKETDKLDGRLERNEITTDQYKELYALLSSQIKAKYDAIKQPEPVTLQRGQHINIDNGVEGYPVVQVAVDQYGNYTLRIVEPGIAGQPDKVVFHEVVTSMAFFAGR